MSSGTDGLTKAKHENIQKGNEYIVKHSNKSVKVNNLWVYVSKLTSNLTRNSNAINIGRQKLKL
jgi:hypothetical protein